jgi:hypothetical protein
LGLYFDGVFREQVRIDYLKESGIMDWNIKKNL